MGPFISGTPSWGQALNIPGEVLRYCALSCMSIALSLRAPPYWDQLRANLHDLDIDDVTKYAHKPLYTKVTFLRLAIS